MSRDQFRDAWHLNPAEPPELPAARVSLRGRVARAVNAASHSLFVVDVDRAPVGRGDPLPYLDHLPAVPSRP